MAQLIAVIQFATILIGCLALKSALVDSEYAKSTPCSFPSSSIACKIWNYTNIDCSRRALVCIPPLRHYTTLQLLDLSDNKVSVLSRDSFSGLINLRTLDLSSNNVSAINGDTFIQLNLLQTLDLSHNSLKSLPDDVFSGLQNLTSLYLNDNPYFSIRNGIFTELGKLQTLDLSRTILVFTSDSPPLQDLHSLRTLSLLADHDHPFVFSPTTFVGLNQTLQVLVIRFYNATTYTPFVQLSSLRYLVLKLANCNHVNRSFFTGLGKLKRLILVSETLGCALYLRPLVSLTHLSYYSWDTLVNCHTCIQVLKSVNSVLQTLRLYFYVSTVRLNSTTFESLPKWKESLQELSICIYRTVSPRNIDIEGSPFIWFKRLKRLRIQGPPEVATPTFYWPSPVNTFKGLTNLKEVHLNYLNINDDIANDVLNTFTNYSLEVFDLAHNDIPPGSIANGFRSLPTLKTIDLSYNLNPSPHIRMDLDLSRACYNSFNLTTLYINNMVWILNQFSSGKCHNLVSLDSSNSEINIANNFVIQAPKLKELYLSGITVTNFPFPNRKILLLKLFNTPKLKTLDLSSNQISVIDKEDNRMLMNVTYLDLRNNQLTSLSNLTHLHHVSVLLVSRNQITTVSRSLLLNNPLQILDLHDNVFVCECTIEGLQKWLLTDKVAYLWNNFSEGNRYKCVEPESSKGFSITEVALDCEVPLLMYISVGITCGLVTIIATILVVRYRWHIQYRLFLLFNRRANQNYLVNDDNTDDDFEDEDGAPRYDAFVIYHNQDEDWVDEQLVANIEEHHEEQFRLSLKNRDIRAGRLIFNELSLHIRRSRKVLVILTPRFVEDNWCYFQLNMAHHRVLEEHHTVLIFIILEEIPGNRLTLLLRQLFGKSLCLKWPDDAYGQNLFWQRLREELKRPLPRDLIHRHRRYNV